MDQNQRSWNVAFSIVSLCLPRKYVSCIPQNNGYFSLRIRSVFVRPFIHSFVDLFLHVWIAIHHPRRPVFNPYRQNLRIDNQRGFPWASKSEEVFTVSGTSYRCYHLYIATGFQDPSYVYWTVHHLDSWIKRDQLDVTCFIISLFTVQHVSDVNLLAPELFFLILAHSVYKMWIIQEPNTLELWNKLHFEEKKT